METTNRDYADKSWLHDDPSNQFQLIPPDLAIFLLIVGGFIGFAFRSFL